MTQQDFVELIQGIQSGASKPNLTEADIKEVFTDIWMEGYEKGHQDAEFQSAILDEPGWGD